MIYLLMDNLHEEKEAAHALHVRPLFLYLLYGMQAAHGQVQSFLEPYLYESLQGISLLEKIVHGYRTPREDNKMPKMTWTFSTQNDMWQGIAFECGSILWVWYTW